MSVVVVIPFHGASEHDLRECLESVLSQSMPVTTVVVVCDRSSPPSLPPGVQLIQLPGATENFTGVARAVGASWAFAQGHQAAAWLDTSCRVAPDHFASLWRIHVETGADVCTSSRMLVSDDGSPPRRCPDSDGEQFADPCSILLTHKALLMAQEWAHLSTSNDASNLQFWNAIRRSSFSRRHSGSATLWRRNDVIAVQAVSAPAASRTDAAGNPFPFEASIRPQTISLCMIVRNEESNLGDCLRTVCDLVDEVVVVDTGSTDRTREIAKSFDVRVVDFPWIEDFAAARNESLQHATSDWIFWMDADDRLDALNRERFKRLRPALPDGAFTFMMKQRSAPEQAGNSPLVVDHARLFRRGPEIRWRYRLHEQILPSLRDAGTKMVFTDLVIDHLGYSHPGTRRAKLDRNLRILQLDLQDRPDDAFVAFNMAGTLLDMGQHPQAVPHLETCIRLVPKGASFAPKAHVLLVKSNRSLGQIDEAERRLAVAKELFPKSAELLFEEGLLHQMRGNHSAARLAFEAILSLEKSPQFVGIDEGVSGHLARHNLAQSLRNLGETAAAEAQWRTAIRQMPLFSPAWLSLLELLLAQKRIADAEALTMSAEQPRILPALPAMQARLLLAQNQPTAAIRILESALDADPNSLWLRLFLCDVLFRDASQVKHLKHHLQQVLAIDPHHAIARAKLSELTKNYPPN